MVTLISNGHSILCGDVGFDVLLIANRGEIAVRIAATAHRLGLRTASVFTEPDADARHVDGVDVAVRVGSYLDADAIVAAARVAGAGAVHPGYGFLSENAGFARAVVDAGLTWVGPPPAAIELMGDKARAKQLAREAGVPTVPGAEGEPADLRTFCGEHGYPVIVKAVGGGGGKGMRVVREASELEPALEAAAREAQAAFGDARVLVERFVERPRHIEVQVLAGGGRVIHLGERECSLQRRHQKVVEEAPSPAVDPPLRERMGAAAVALALACGYEGAGTVEFIAPLDASSFFFLEMNTRIQVEHTVTELVYGVDLVEHQLRIAAGEPLALTQETLRPRGHAVEARLYAEDPAHGFLPATGTVLRYREPAGVRIDSGIREGSVIDTSFDPMLAKIVAHGADRPTALRRIDRALGELEVVGVETSAAFTRALLRHAAVRAGEQDTGLLERVRDELIPAPPADLLPASAVARYLGDTAGATTPPGPWRRVLDRFGEVRVAAGTVEAGGRTWAWSAGPERDGARRIELDGVARRYAIARDDDALWLARDGHQLQTRPERKDRTDAGVEGSLEAPMPGTVLLVHVANGDSVCEGDVLLVLESMKMELSITAPVDGTVDGLSLRPGDKVALRERLVAVVP